MVYWAKEDVVGRELGHHSEGWANGVLGLMGYKFFSTFKWAWARKSKLDYVSTLNWEASIRDVRPNLFPLN